MGLFATRSDWRLILGVHRKDVVFCKRVWTDDERDFLRRNLNVMTNVEIGWIFGRSKSSVSGQCHKLGLRRDADVRNRMMRSTQFKTGDKPWNCGIKGMHMSPGTEFRKGNLPAGTRFDGCMTLRRHKRTGLMNKWIRVGLSDWMPLNRYNWEQAHGPVPDGHIVGFKDGDVLNCELGNLYCISKKDNVRRNSDPEKASRSMKIRWKSDVWIKSDKYIAALLFQRDEKMRRVVRRFPEILNLKRLQFKLRRSINDTVSDSAEKIG